MIIMRDGLQELAGSAMRSAMMRFTKSPATGAITGATITAILQSSSATTVAAVGFVSAGLLSFTNSLGIIFGANIGTTIKGWAVALLGFKFDIANFLYPFIFIGAILRLFARDRLASAGYIIAGFGVIFVGITVLQQGMENLSGIITPESLPSDTIIGRLELVGLGIIATLITQSSSAGVATALTAVYTGAINFEQAAALVIGMDVGTTVTAAMAAIGGSTDARRTGLSHVIYNLFTGVGALLLITPYTWAWDTISPGSLTANAEIGLVGFHTLFNTLGVIIVLPITSQFAALIQKIIPGKPLIYTSSLQRVLLEEPGLALTAVQNTLQSELIALLGHVESILSNDRKGQRIDLPELKAALDTTGNYLDEIHLKTFEGADWERMIALTHSLDHMQRLHERCEEDEDRARTASTAPELLKLHDILMNSISENIEDIATSRWTQCTSRANKTAVLIHDEVEPLRSTIVEKTARDTLDVDNATHCLEAIRWLERVSQHIARISFHFEQAILAAGK